ncbi:MAG: alpha/beta fold hydrolase [Pseudonocardiaceae bacterium]|nr:alpha/beta fold hydrolase [Pseudonocardiaceae bacterium]
MNIPVALSEGAPKDYTIYGEMCAPNGEPTPTVQLLLHGGTYSHIYWDFPYQDGKYSYVRHTVPRGYTTLAIDRIGAGNSSHPVSTKVGLESNAFTVHQIVQRLRTDGLGAGSFSKVVLVGHSYGSFTSWLEASTYRDVDGVIVTGALHELAPVGAASIATYLSWPAALNPRWRQLDPGYLTTRPDTRAPFFYNTENADPDVIAMDERTKETVTATELATFPPRMYIPTTEGIRVPVFLVVGQKDAVWCGTGGADCTSAEAVEASESPHYGPETCLQTFVLPNSGHDVNLHLNAHDWYEAADRWTDRFIGSSAERSAACPAAQPVGSGGE